MKVGRKRTGLLLLGAGTVALMLGGMTMSASAAPVASSFAARYAKNANLEAELLQKAQAESGSSQNVTALSSAVQSIETEAATLYSAEEALLTAKAGIPATSASERLKLQAQKRILERDLTGARAAGKGKEGKKQVARRERQLQIKAWTAQLREVTYALKHPRLASGAWRGHPLHGGLTALQQSILDLQAAAIHYTELWIAAAQSPTSAAGSPASVRGLAYGSATITIPAAGATSVTDSVYSAPVVTDGEGNVLSDSGTYTIAGPSVAAGVSIGAATGLLTVNPDATQGTYAVTYTQGSAEETVDIALQSAAPGAPASITGLGYATATIVIPAANAAPVTDAVYSAPVVTDGEGNVLTDSGVYSIAGPSGASGVAIDTATGLVTINPGATAGTYTVTYTQGNVNDTASLTVSP